MGTGRLAQNVLLVLLVYPSVEESEFFCTVLTKKSVLFVHIVVLLCHVLLEYICHRIRMVG